MIEHGFSLILLQLKYFSIIGLDFMSRNAKKNQFYMTLPKNRFRLKLLPCVLINALIILTGCYTVFVLRIETSEAMFVMIFVSSFSTALIFIFDVMRDPELFISILNMTLNRKERTDSSVMSGFKNLIFNQFI